MLNLSKNLDFIINICYHFFRSIDNQPHLLLPNSGDVCGRNQTRRQVMKFFLMLVVLFSLPTTAQVYVTPAPCVRGLLPPSPRHEVVYVQQRPVVHTTRVVVQRSAVYTPPTVPCAQRQVVVLNQPPPRVVYVQAAPVSSILGFSLNFSLGFSGGAGSRSRSCRQSYRR